MSVSTRYRYLNADGRWPTFRLTGLDVGPEGAVRLAALPAGGSAEPFIVAAPAGLTFGDDGAAYWTDPATSTLWSAGPCLPPTRVPCVGGSGMAPTQFRSPTGVLLHRRRLYVADTGNARVQVFDPRTWQLLAVWRGFVAPRAVAGDAAGFVYVLDDGNRRVMKFDTSGVARGEFVAPTAEPWHPADVAVVESDGVEHVLVLDSAARAVYRYVGDGTFRERHPLCSPARPEVLTALPGGVVFVGDRRHGTVEKYHLGPGCRWEPLGAAHFRGPLAAMAADGCGSLGVLPGGPTAPVRLDLTGACGTPGGLWGGPFVNPILTAVSWQRLKATAAMPESGGSLQLYVRLEQPGSRTSVTAPWGLGESAVRDLMALQQAPAYGVWFRAARNVAECLFPAGPEDRIWLAVAMTSDGTAGPVVEQLRLDHQFEHLLRRLPECYSEAPPAGGFVGRLAGLFASLFEDASDVLDRLPARFTPHAPESDLPALAELVGLEREAKPDDVADAVARHAVRGTRRGLIAAVRRRFGEQFPVAIDEPIRHAAIWVLPDDTGKPTEASGGVGSLLGVTTGLASGTPHGAVVGSSLVLGQSHALADEDFGAPLFADLAHRVVVRVPACPASGPDYLDELRAIIERELPAHVAYDLCPVEPPLRLGVQARLGIDAVLAVPPTPAPLGTTPGLVLDGPRPRVGLDARLGRGAVLGSDTHTDIPPRAPHP